ncbi:MAG: response regulator [Dethiobacteria bacterium]|nr:response regulator transcription factor [Bacillota bacterium]MDW7729851.1 response regulator transcription factor [Bacillota bacterium]
MKEIIKVVIADDQQLMREGLKTILELEKDIIVQGTAANGKEALDLCRSLKPDIALMDIRMPEMDGVEATRQISAAGLKTKVIVVTTFDDDELIVKALKAGAKTYLLKDLPSEKLLAVIRATYRGDIVMQPEIAAKLVERASGELVSAEVLPSGRSLVTLTSREKEILSLMAEGLNNGDIASTLFLSEGTVKNQVSIIYSKLGTNDRTQAVLLALKNNLI